MRLLLCAITAHVVITDREKKQTKNDLTFFSPSCRIITTFAGFVVTTLTNFGSYIVTNHLLGNRSHSEGCLGKQIKTIVITNYINRAIFT